MIRTGAMTIFASLLDRSVARIGELAADGRYFDREEVIQVSNIWDNYTTALFTALLSRPAWVRERRARAALRRMAQTSDYRRTWMIEQAAVAGHRLEPVLGPSAPEATYRRNHLGLVCHGWQPLTAAAAVTLTEDYDLQRAAVRSVRVERAGRKLRGTIGLVVPRRYAALQAHDDASVNLHLNDVETARLDSADAAGASVAVGADGIEVRVGTRGLLRGTSAAIDVDDSSWHLSRAGRVADTQTPECEPNARRRPRRSGVSQPYSTAWEVAGLLRLAMWLIRSVRYSHRVGQVPLEELCACLANAGGDLFAAAEEPRAARDRAFRRLAERWIAGSPQLARETPIMFGPGSWVHVAAGSPVRASAKNPRFPPAPVDSPRRAQLTLLSYTATHTQYSTEREASAVINFAVPDGNGRWSLRTERFERPDRLVLDAAAFHAPDTVSRDTVSRTGGEALSLGAGTLVLTREPELGPEPEPGPGPGSGGDAGAGR